MTGILSIDSTGRSVSAVVDQIEARVRQGI